MQNLYPLFERNRILKKELMWSLRDYSFTHIQLEYQTYADGIIKGCEIEVREKELVVGKGIVKYDGFIYLITEEMRIAYEPTEQLEILKMKMEVDKRSEDFIAYRITLFLDNNPVKKEGELEVCRFKLRCGSRLRSQYKDFEDMATDFDTVNVIEADWGGVSGKTISPSVTGYFAENVLAESGSLPEDVSFAYLCLNQREAVSRKVLEHYINTRLGTKEEYSEKYRSHRGEEKSNTGNCLKDNRKVFEQMVQIINDIRSNRHKGMEIQTKRRQIVVE